MQRKSGALQALRSASRNLISEWVVTLIFFLFGTTTMVQAFVIPTGSMEDNLLVGDHVLVDKLAYAPSGPLTRGLLPYQEIKRGDVIVFRFPPDIQQTYVKRCMGLPGDRLRMVNKQFYLNGRKLDEPYIFHKSPVIEPSRDNFPPPADMPVAATAVDMLQHHVIDGELVVPPGHYFALGDNRDNSSDSRVWGLVPRANIIGKPILIYWSYDAPTEHLIQPTIGIDHLLDLAQNFFTKTRWDRTFRFIHGYPVK
ncbi:MAG TPA: signal peptidase I [Bryobacteraceae bacterium]|nr:signal peptidase I [Bryobacteraceae bacterium]